jgi:hypothetical protein
MARLSGLAAARMKMQDGTNSPVSAFFHLSHNPAKLSVPSSSALMK